MKRFLFIALLSFAGLVHGQSLRLNSGGNTLLFHEDTTTVKASFFQGDAVTAIFSDQNNEAAEVSMTMMVVTPKGSSTPQGRSGSRETVFPVNRKEIKKGSMLVITARRPSLQDEVFVVKVE